MNKVTLLGIGVIAIAVIYAIVKVLADKAFTRSTMIILIVGILVGAGILYLYS